MEWTDQRITDLRRYADEGLSAANIAAVMGGLTRSAILGKCYRLGMSLRGQPGAPRPRLPKPKREASYQRRSPRKSQPGRALEPETIDLPADQSTFACTIVDLSHSMCRYPLGDPSPDMHYCGAPCVGSWCRRHRRIVEAR